MKRTTDISALVDSLHEDNFKDTPSIAISKSKPKAAVIDVTALDDFLEYALESKLKCEKVSYIDPEIHEVLAIIKRKKNIPIGILLSFLAKEFITSYKTEIKNLFGPNELLK